MHEIAVRAVQLDGVDAEARGALRAVDEGLADALQARGIKRERYAHFGIPEYWIVDTERRRIEIHRLADPTRLPMVVTDRLRWQPVEGGRVLDLDVAELMRDLG